VGVRLTDDEAWQRLGETRTGIVVTLRSDGRPLPLPVWFVVIDRTICFGTPPSAKKVVRLRNDARVSFLVESGDRWTELSGVVVQGRADLVDDPAVTAQVEAMLNEKYAGLGAPRGDVPQATRQHYAAHVIVRLVPDEPLLSWDNAKIRLRS
jgi:PPOX class probable F420-dependent enzyme